MDAACMFEQGADVFQASLAPAVVRSPLFSAALWWVIDLAPMPVPEAHKLRMLGRLELVTCRDINELLFSTLQPSKLWKGRSATMNSFWNTETNSLNASCYSAAESPLQFEQIQNHPLAPHTVPTLQPRVSCEPEAIFGVVWMGNPGPRPPKNPILIPTATILRDCAALTTVPLLSHELQRGLPCLLNSSSERSLGSGGANLSLSLCQQFK